MADGLHQVVVHRLEPGEIDEATAADLVSRPFVSDGIEARTAVGGRINFYSKSTGLFRANRSLVDDFNSVDDAITFACLDDFSQVRAGDLVGTTKIIPLAVSRQSVGEALRTISAAVPILVKPFIPHTATILSTISEGLAAKTIAKTVRTTTDRLLARNGEIISEVITDHSVDSLANALRSQTAIQRYRPHLIIVFGASAVADQNDVVPSAIRAAGGRVERIGMPVDPGNLAVLGSLRGTVVIGAPGCARSPAMNGLDFILDRVIAGEDVSRAAFARMGVGGLLNEIKDRTQRREDSGEHVNVADLRKIA
ncbi:molybdopterin-binding protein [Rhizobium bangladeshense]|uniref:molybdopterin-binding protein n=1 Tax=Rhizobium bangladeshense TaxID=1138189 RepID=UPI001FD931AE|nr:molybdopterin-binding protein [Rhizobium bangladeshense]